MIRIILTEPATDVPPHVARELEKRELVAVPGEIGRRDPDRDSIGVATFPRRWVIGVARRSRRRREYRRRRRGRGARWEH